MKKKFCNKTGHDVAEIFAIGCHCQVSSGEALSMVALVRRWAGPLRLPGVVIAASPPSLSPPSLSLGTHRLFTSHSCVR